MTFYDLNMNSKKLTATNGVENGTTVLGTSKTQTYKAYNDGTVSTATELRLNSGSTTNTGTVELFVNPDPTNTGIYSYSVTNPGLFLKSAITSNAFNSGEYCQFTDNGFSGVNELTENGVYLRNSSTISNNSVLLRTAFDYLGYESRLYLSMDTFALTVGTGQSGGAVLSVQAGNTPLVCNRILQFGTNPQTAGRMGVYETSTINATTTGTTTLTSGNAFTTHINTPSASGRIFVLPAPSLALVGYWWAVCNKSASQSITIQSSSGVTIGTISATIAGGAGNVIKIGIDNAGTGYFRVA